MGRVDPVPSPSLVLSPPGCGGDGLIEEALQVLGETSSADQLYAYMGTLCARLGFPYYSYFVADRLHPDRRAVVDPMVATSYPEAWRAHYRSRAFQNEDPVLSAGGSARRPFTWGDRTYREGLEGKPKRVIEDAYAFGIHSGLTIPVYGPGGDNGVFTVATPDGGAAFEDVVRKSLTSIHFIAHQLHAATIELLVPQPVPKTVRLTEQERTCLLWTLRGKTSWEIGQIIDRSTSAVNFHLQKVLRKLGTSNKSHAAIIALRAGLI